MIRTRDLIWPVTVVLVALIIAVTIGVINYDNNQTRTKVECVKSGGTPDYKYGNLICNRG